jgi:hypothetical protein
MSIRLAINMMRKLMTHENTHEGEPNKLPRGSKIIPSEEFVKYCEVEFERRLNSGEEFDEAAYREAMEMVLEKLKTIESEGQL